MKDLKDINALLSKAFKRNIFVRPIQLSNGAFRIETEVNGKFTQYKQEINKKDLQETILKMYRHLTK